MCPYRALAGDRSGGYHSCVRVLGIDFGKRRIGLAISDPSGTLARPLATLQARGDHVAQVAEAAERFAREDDGLGAIVVGLPSRLDGSANEQTALVLAFVETTAGASGRAGDGAGRAADQRGGGEPAGGP